MESLKCIHCHSAFTGSGSFCCTGCQAVYNFINSRGLSQFYKLLNNETKLEAPLLDAPDLEDISTYVTQASNGLNRISFYSDSLICSACHWLVNQIPAVFKEVKAARSKFGENIIEVEFETGVSPSQIALIFKSLGLTVTPVHRGNDPSQLVRRNFLTKIAFSMASLLGTMHTSLFLYAGLLSQMNVRQNQILGLLSMAVSLPAIIIGGSSFYSNAISSLRLKILSIDILVSISVALGFFASIYNLIIGKNEYYFDAVTMLIAFLLLGRYLAFEIEYQMSKKTKLDPISNRSRTPSIGEVIKVRSGEIFPCDGIIEKGESQIDSSWLTGESELQKISHGQAVFHGSMNIGDEVVVKCTKSGNATKLSQLFLELGHIDKAAIPNQFRKIENIFVGAILILMTALLFTRINATTYVAVILVICPCALGLAIPSSFISAVFSLFKKGIYFKNASILMDLSTIDTIVLDVTGTITNYRRDIVKCTWVESNLRELGIPKDTLNQIIYSMICRSNHPILKPLQTFFTDQTKLSEITITEVLSKGIQATTLNKEFKIGSAKFCENSEIQSDLFFTVDGKLVCYFDLEIQIKPEAIPVIKEISKGRELFIATGSSNHNSVLRIAKILKIDPQNVYIQQSPQAKLKLIESLVAQDKKVMMVGDGYNDVQAFKKSHISVAISGAIGPSLTFADIYLSNPTLEGISNLFYAAGKVSRQIKINLSWTFFYNMIGLALVIKGLIGPIVCAVLMPLGSLTVALGSYMTRYTMKEI